jgi:transposase
LRRAGRDDLIEVREMIVTQQDVQVVAKPLRRTHSAGYKRRILKEVGAYTAPGAGPCFAREGFYSSRLVGGSGPRGRGEMAALAPRKRGCKPTPLDPRDRKSTELEWRLAAMTGSTSVTGPGPVSPARP